MAVGGAEVKRWLALLVGACFILLALGFLVCAVLVEGAIISKQHDAIKRLEERAPCEGCFESLKWRVDIHHPVQPGGPYEQTYGSDPRQKGAVQPASPGGSDPGNGGED